MERTRLALYLVAAAAIAVLLAALAQSYMALQAANADLAHYKQQQRELARAVAAEYMPDMQAARARWISAHPAEFRDLQGRGIGIEADYVGTAHFTAALDPADAGYISLGPPDSSAAGTVTVGLGQYFEDNLTRASGWVAYYAVNRTTGDVSGFTAALAQSIAYDHYVADIDPGVGESLGVARDTVTGFSAITLDTSYLPDRNVWQDVTEYRYSLRNTDQPAYLMIKTYINATTEAVEGVDISQPYYTSASTTLH